MNTVTELKTFKDSYPHQLIMDGENLTLVANVKHSVGDGFTFGWNHNKGTTDMVVWRVTEIVETRKPKGNHKDKKAMFYSFKVKQSVEDTTEIEIIQP